MYHSRLGGCTQAGASNGPLVKWLRRRPLTPQTGVRLSYGSPLFSGENKIHLILTEKSVRINESVLIAVRVHPFPSRTRQLSSLAPKILGWRRPGKIGSADTIERSGLDRTRPLLYSSLAQSVEHAAVNRRVVGSSPTGGANLSVCRHFGGGIRKSDKNDRHGPLAQLVRAAGS